MIRLTQLKLPLNHAHELLAGYAARALGVPVGDILSVRLRKKSVDARDKSDICFVATLDVDMRTVPARLPAFASAVEPDAPRVLPTARRLEKRPVVVGMGPAGLFAALTLARMGLAPLVIERGKPVDARANDVERFWNAGKLNPDSNALFGEGGAGAFSDGKLNTGIKDIRCRYVLEDMCAAGAPEDILYMSKPHVGTDILRGMVKKLREEISALGGEIRFETKLESIIVESGRVVGAVISGETVDTNDIILAIGHSARDTFYMLRSLGVRMERKPFSIGARIEHSQKMIDVSQYGAFAAHPALGAADYKLSERMPDGRGVYTFCMCPGGVVVASASESGGVVTNGMSMRARDGENANSGLLVSVEPSDFGGADALAGVEFQRKWEKLAFELGGGNYRAPAQLVGDFLKRVKSAGAADIMPTYRPGVEWTDISKCLPEFAADAMRRALPAFGRRIKGFDSAGAVLTGVETRSSSPVRILRGADLNSSVRGLYPCGEGAGYAGGILSAAVDGMRCAEALGSKND